MATTSSFNDILKRVVKERWPANSPQVGTASSGGAATFVITGMASSYADVNAYDGVIIYIIYDATAADGTPQGDYRTVNSGGYSTTGTWTVGSNWASVTDTGDIAVFLYGRDPDQMLEVINRVQRSVYMPRYLVLTSIPDGDLEAATTATVPITTYWSDVSAPATATAKVTTAGKVLLGTQALRFVSDAVGEGTKSNKVAVHETESVLVSVPVLCVSGSAKVGLMEGDGTEIKAVTVDEVGYTEVRFTASIPDDCEEVYIQVISATAVSDIYIGYVGMLPTNRDVIALPSQVVDAADLEEVVYLPAGLTSETSESYIALSRAFELWPCGDSLRDWEAVAAQRITVSTPISSPLFLKFRAHALADMSRSSTGSATTRAAGDNSTTTVPIDLLVEGVLAELMAEFAKGVTDQERRNQVILESQGHAHTFGQMLDSLGLVRPKGKMSAQRRVSVRG